VTVVDPDLFRALLRRHAAAVVVVTAPGTPPAGFTATSFTSVSLEPPLVSFCLAHTASSWPAVSRASLVAVHVLADHFRTGDLRDWVVVSPDLGNAKMATALARLLRLPVAAASKRRLSDDTVVIDRIVGDVHDRNVIVLDDEIATAGSIIELLRKLRAEGVREVSLACTHGLYTGPAIERLKQEPGIREIVATNTVPLPDHKRLPNMVTRSVAPLFAEAVRRIHLGESVSSLFSDEETYG